MNNSTTATSNFSFVNFYQTLLIAQTTSPAVAVCKWLGIFTWAFGIIGNGASLITFTRPALRKVSSGFLYIILAISDTIFLIVFFIDFLDYAWEIPVYESVLPDEFCRFRGFVSSGSQLFSAWVLVVISIDRWIRTRLPFKAPSICTPKNAFIILSIFLVIDVGLQSHFLTPWYRAGLIGIISFSCGAKYLEVSVYKNYYTFIWPILDVFVSCLVPATITLTILIDIYINVRIRKRQLSIQTLRQNKYRDVQMFILMLSRINIFFLATLPLSLYTVMSPRQTISLSYAGRISLIAILTWIRSLNFSINFYIHCLTSKLFRKQFTTGIKSIFGYANTEQDIVATVLFVNTRKVNPTVQI